MHARGSSDPYKSACPTCRAPFPIGTVTYFIPCTVLYRPNANRCIPTSVKPDLSIVPEKYHRFISPPLRRVFLDGREDNSHVQVELLNAEIARLEERVTSLNRDNDLLVDRCNSAQGELARLARCKAKADALKVKEVLNRLIVLILCLFLLALSLQSTQLPVAWRANWRWYWFKFVTRTP